MPSNVVLDPGVGGATAATKQITHDGDTAQVQMMGLFGLSGTEDAYTAGLINGDSTNGIDVDITRVIPGTSATHLGKAEDDAAASGDVGVAVLTVRQDTPASSTSADGDYQHQKSDANGRTWVNASGVTLTVAAHDVTNAGTFAVQAAQSGAWNIGTVTTVTTVSAVTAITNALPAGTNNIGDVDVLSVVPGTGATNLGKAVDSAAGATDTGVAPLYVRDDALSALTPIEGDYVNGRVDSTGAIWVRVTNGITGATHDSAAASEGVQQMVEGRSTDGTAVTAGDAVRVLGTLLGKQINLPYALPGQTWSYAAASGGITNTTGVTARAAQAAGIRNYITSIQVINGHATVSTDVQIRDGAAGTVLHRGFAQAAGGGYSVKCDPPLRGTAATLVEIACGTTGAAVYVNLQGYSAAE